LNHTGFIHHLTELQELLDATLHVVVINTPYNMKRSKYEQSELDEFARHYRLKNFTLNVRGDFTEEAGIAGFADEIHADMIALGTHGRRGLAHLFAGSIAEHVVNHLACPIWTCRL
jgi:nucleotide-binding universal stress UspA family protein